MKETTAPCSSWIRQTAHRILHEKSIREEDRITNFAMLECCGCRKISLAEQVRFIPDGEIETNYYPSPVSRKEPNWLFSLTIGLAGNKKDSHLGSLLYEIYQAVHGGQYRLAAMGIRALLEQVMVSKVGDLGSFGKQLDAFQNAGYFSLVQRDTMKATLDIGHAAIHRAFRPTEQDLQIALDVVEGVMAPMYHHQNAAEKMIERVPPRPPRKS